VAAVTLAEAKEVVVVVVAEVGPRRQGRRGPTLAGQFLALQLVVVALVLLIVGVFSVRQSTASFATERGSAMRSVAEYVANLPIVRCQLGSGGPACPTRPAPVEQTAGVLAGSVSSGLATADATDVLIVAPDDAEVLAAAEPSLVGTRAPLGDSDAQLGRGWTGDVEVDGERTVAAHAPIIAEDGTLIGIAIAQQRYPSVADRLTGAAPDLVLFLGIGTLLGGLGTFVVSRIVRRRTRGLGAAEFDGLADQREALLHSIREGVVAVRTDRRVTMMNDAARAVLGVEVDPVGRSVDDLGLDPRVVALLADGSGEVRDAVALVGTHVVVFNRRAASSQRRGIGLVTTVRDRTELVSLQTQLSSNLSLTDTLRAQTHEFDNQLHTISGLVQLGEYDEVSTLVGSITRARGEAAVYVSQRLEDPAVAALVVAKVALAAERDVELALDPGSRLPALDPAVSADLTSVLGNLVDNAVDAAAGQPDALVEVWLTLDRDVVHLRVRDTGPGVPDQLREAVFVRGFSTKPEVLGGRGIGLPLVQLICSARGGSVSVGRAEAEGGAEFVVTLPVGASVGSEETEEVGSR